MTDPATDETLKAAAEAAEMPAVHAAPATDSATGADDGPSDAAGEGVERPRYRGWYWLGILIQVFVWTLIWLGIAIAVGVGGELTEFRYVGF